MQQRTPFAAEPKIREARVKVGMTQEELAKQLGVSRQTVSNLEHGRTLPNLAILFLIAGILGVAWYTLYSEGGKNDG
ncbi:helix-turn-helix transcriptional regulator [Alicyclobacillus sp. SO9]|uniref:helix-turn-helix transcriptional regulator n=1 Tax=Alicyclobacillus sp. SO9 TaxID=2665646 RepID=UPI0018E7A522|nr:helix-turn-helix transcriptional regulator [Alicyclobacillus sp. SO9]QQE79517.1 helix-turn-helix transcriptional regulator [Alicyclobacillus sp. SO9]